MSSTAIVTEDTAILSTEGRRFDWGAAIAAAIAATAVAIFLLTLGSGVGLSLISANSSAVTFLTLGAIYVFAAQAFAFTVGGYLVGRLIGPEGETSREEEFIAAAHGLTVWALIVVAGLLVANFTPVIPTVAHGEAATANSYWTDVLFMSAPNTSQIVTDKAEVSRIWTQQASHPATSSAAGEAIITDLVARDVAVSTNAAAFRVSDTEKQMRQDLARKAKAASYVTLWAAFSLLFGAIVAMAAAVSARWMDDKVSFSFASRWR